MVHRFHTRAASVVKMREQQKSRKAAGNEIAEVERWTTHIKKHSEVWVLLIVCLSTTCAYSTDAVYLISRLTAHQDDSHDAMASTRKQRHGGFLFKHLNSMEKQWVFWKCTIILCNTVVYSSARQTIDISGPLQSSKEGDFTLGPTEVNWCHFLKRMTAELMVFYCCRMHNFNQALFVVKINKIESIYGLDCGNLNNVPPAKHHQDRGERGVYLWLIPGFEIIIIILFFM